MLTTPPTYLVLLFALLGFAACETDETLNAASTDADLAALVAAHEDVYASEAYWELVGRSAATDVAALPAETRAQWSAEFVDGQSAEYRALLADLSDAATDGVALERAVAASSGELADALRQPITDGLAARSTLSGEELCALLPTLIDAFCGSSDRNDRAICISARILLASDTCD